MPYGTINTLFIILCILLVFLMQPGFLCLEAGAVRSKNTVNVAAKNLIDLMLITLFYCSIGFTIQYGWFSDLASNAHPEAPYYPYLFLLFQTLFSATAATIVSGTIAERCGLTAYVVISLIIVTLIYPVSGQWVWGGVFGSPEGWLAKLGFVDFAGSTQVHALGGSVALAAVLIIGPRQGFRTRDSSAFRGQNQALSMLGVMLLWLGWFGFNMGSFLQMDTLIPVVLINTFVAACAGGLASLYWSAARYRKADIPTVANGVLAGLVGITAGVHVMLPQTAVLVGAVSGLICCALMMLFERCQIDDVIGAIPVHLGGGIWGTLAVALLGDPDILNTGNSFMVQLGVQLLGTVTVSVWAFTVSFILLKLINSRWPLRVSKESEYHGLNISEHGATTELSVLIHDMEKQADEGKFKPLVMDPFSELSGITRQYNRIFQSFTESQSKLEINIETLQTIRDQLLIQKDIAEAANRHKSLFLTKISHEIRTPLNGIIAMSELLQTEPLNRDQKESVDIIIESGRALMDIINDVLDFSLLESGQLTINHQTFDLPELLNQCHTVFLPETVGRDIAFEVNIETDAPETMMGDSQRIRQVIVNLLDNAFKFTEQGCIVLSAKPDELAGQLVIEVSDTGKGIAPERLEAVFRAFEQEDNSTTRRYDGNGLGLSMSKQLVELMGGTISVTSEQNKGSIFKFQIPTSNSTD